MAEWLTDDIMQLVAVQRPIAVCCVVMNGNRLTAKAVAFSERNV